MVSIPKKVKEHIEKAQIFEDKQIYVDAVEEYQSALEYDKENVNIIEGSSNLNKKIIDTAFKKKLDIRIGNINTSDLFYNTYENPKIKENFCLGVEMETFALFYIADKLNKEAASILTVSDNLVSKEILSSEEREKTFDEAITLALDSIL